MITDKIALHRRLTSKFIAIAFVVSILPLAFLYYFSTNSATEMLVNTLRDDLKEKSFLVGADIDRYFTQREHDVRVLSQADVLEGNNIEQIIQYLTEVIQETPYLDDIDVIDPSGMVIASSGQQNEKGKHVLELYPELKTLFNNSQKAKQGDIFVSNILELDSGAGLAFLTPITDDSNKIVIKTLLVEINLDTVKKIVADFDERVVGDKYVYLVDNDGRVIVTADPKVKLLDLFPDLFAQRDLLDKFSDQGEVGSIVYVDNDGQEVMAGFADMAEFGVNKAMDWSIIAVAPLSDITQPVTGFKQVLLIFTLIVFFIAISLLYIASRNILRAVEDLVDGARKVAGGNLGYRVDASSKDEFGYLAKSINHTLDHLVSVQKEAQKATKTKSAFLAAMSHEIRTPMAGIIGMTDLLTNSQLTAEQLNWSRNIGKSSNNLLKLLNEILDQSKLEAGKVKIEKQDFYLTDYIEQTVNLYGPRMASKKLKYHVNIESNVPKGIHADQTRIGQVLSNLLTNAIKFSEAAGHINVNVSLINSNSNSNSNSNKNRSTSELYDSSFRDVSTSEHTNEKEAASSDGPKKMICITVSDTGIGLEDEIQEKLFYPFIQADNSTSRKYGGTGLGLAISKQLVQLMGGEIGVKSVVAIGSKFYFTVPYEANKLPIVTNSDNKSQFSWTSTRSLKILIAEDTSVLQIIITKLLANLSHKVVVAENGRVVIDKLQKESFDLILMDIRMPKMDGMEASRIIRAMDPDKSNIPIIALTADIAEGNINEYLQSGINDVCSKPVDLNELLPAINKLFDEQIHLPTDKVNKVETVVSNMQGKEKYANISLVETTIKDQISK